MANTVKIKFIRCLESNLADIAIADGQIVICRDTGKIYFDFGMERIAGFGDITVDESRLLPENPANGDIPCFDATATVGGGNDANTKLLIQPETGNNQILDQAAGNAAPVGITNSGNVAIAANALVFSGENALIIEPNTLGMTLGGNNEYSIEVDFQLDQVKNDWATLFGGDGSMTRSAFYINSSGATAVQGGIAPDTTGWTTGTRHRLTIERFQDGDSWKTVIYRNGAVLATSVTTPNTLSGDRFPIGSNLEGTGRNFVGKIWAFRISNKAIHKGQSFTPDELPWTKPQTVGEWGKLNKSLLAQKSDVLPEWHQLSGSSAITLDRANGELQKVTLTQNCTLTAPVLDADHPTLLLQITSGDAVTVTIGETEVISGKSGAWQIGWYWDGSMTRRYPVVEVS